VEEKSVKPKKNILEDPLIIAQQKRLLEEFEKKKLAKESPKETPREPTFDKTKLAFTRKER
jgi:hypothetical protein